MFRVAVSEKKALLDLREITGGKQSLTLGVIRNHALM
jgi:hypothetical protein